MGDNLQEEFTVPALVEELTLWKRAQRKATQYKGPGIESNLLLALLTLFPNEQDRVQLLESPAREPDAGQD